MRLRQLDEDEKVEIVGGAIVIAIPIIVFLMVCWMAFTLMGCGGIGANGLSCGAPDPARDCYAYDEAPPEYKRNAEIQREIAQAVAAQESLHPRWEGSDSTACIPRAAGGVICH